VYIICKQTVKQHQKQCKNASSRKFLSSIFSKCYQQQRECIAICCYAIDCMHARL